MRYWDTSVILQLYANEANSAGWQAVASDDPVPLKSSALVIAEMALALRQKEARGEIIPGSAKILHGLFEEDVRAGRFELTPIGQDVLQATTGLIGWNRTAQHPTPLRTLDAIHLSTAISLKCTCLATADRRLAQAAEACGLRVEIRPPHSTGG